MSSFKIFINRYLLKILVIVVIFSSGITLRSLFITADPPKDITISGGIIGDPGQYQYGARNRILFGQENIDDFTPHAFSPFIHPINTLVYSWFGISLTTHRIIPLVFSILILFFFWILAHLWLDQKSALLSTIFLAFSYPIIVYSHVAYREFPMTLFCLLSFWTFAKGTEPLKLRPFFISALFFFLSFLSKGSGIYLLAVFFVIGLLWLIERRIKLRHLTIFFLSLTFFFLIWWLTIYSSNKSLFVIFFIENRNVRLITDLSILFKNLWQSPMMIILKNDPVLIISTIVSVYFLLLQRLKHHKTIPPIIDVSIIWLACGVLFHGIAGYRPTRFYLILILPAAIIAGYGLSLALKSSSELRPRPHHLLLGILIVFPLLIGIGFPAYLSLAPTWSPLQLAIHLAILIFLLLCFFPQTPVFMRKASIIALILLSISLNMNAYHNWSKQREYEIPAIVEILNKAIPPSRIAGNWASHLSIGTPHKTFYAWRNFFNWQKDFLERNQIEYLLLAKSGTFDEIADYRGFFLPEWNRTTLLAEFSLNNAMVHLYQLDHIPLNSTLVADQGHQILEFEAMQRNSGLVRYFDFASNKMLIKIPLASSAIFTPYSYVKHTIHSIELTSSGHFLLEIRDDNQVLSRFIVNTSGPQLQKSMRYFSPPLEPAGKLSIFIKPIRPDKLTMLDQIVFYHLDGVTDPRIQLNREN